MRSCLKVTTLCTVVLNNGVVIEATNECDVDGKEVCPRVEAGCATGEGYELCGSVHAEYIAARKIIDRGFMDVGGIAYITHYDRWICRSCQHQLQDVGINQFVIIQQEEDSE